MELVIHKQHKGGRLMPRGKGAVVTDARGFVFLAGNTGSAEDYDPCAASGVHAGGGQMGDAAAQWRAVLANIKKDLQALGSSLDHLMKITY